MLGKKFDLQLFADDITRIQDVIQPEVFTPYAIQRTMELSALIQSGIAQHTSEFDTLASGPNTLINMPFWNDLKGDAETMDDTGETTPGKITANDDIAIKQGWVKSYGVNALSAMLSGDDPMRAIADMFASYWGRWNQTVLLSLLDGVFASPSMAVKVHDITGKEGDAAYINGKTFVDATQLMGDAKDNLTGVMMHSAVESYLRKLDLIEYDTVADKSTRMRRFLDHTVIVDDAMHFDTETGAGVGYIFGEGAIAWGNGSHPDIQQTEVVRKGLSLAGEDILVNRRLPLLHPRGVKWTGAVKAKTFPSLAELENGANWQRVYEPKAVRVVKFMFKIQ